MDEALYVQGLSKTFDHFALQNIHFTLPTGYIMGLIGPNGSGKTTIIKLLLNMLRRSAGEIRIFGLDAIAHEQEIKKNIGGVFDTNYFVEEWKVSQAEKMLSLFYANWDVACFTKLLERFHIRRDQQIRTLSKGMQMKLMVACAFSYDAKLLILDEPTSGLDPVSRDELLDILSAYIEDGAHSVLFSTHITRDLEKIADYITYVHFGSLLYTGTKDGLLEMYRVVKGGLTECTPDLRKSLIGLRTFSTGFEGLLPTAQTDRFPHLLQENASIDDIMIWISRGKEDHA